MRLRRALGPFGRASTARRGAFLLVGGAIVVPYVVLGWTFAVLLADRRTPVAPVVALAAVMAVIGVVPAMLATTRVVEITAVRRLLGAQVPDPPPPDHTRRRPSAGWETRTRTAAWYVLHLGAGAFLTAVGLLSISLLVMSVFDLTRTELFDWFVDVPRVLLLGLGVVGLLGSAFLANELGALLGRLAPRFLGPSAAERVAALEVRTRELAERNQLARELHDSVGDALAVATLQAAAAGTLLDRDPDDARRALSAIEDAGRRAIADLDHVLAVLRTGETRTRFAPQGTLLDLERLVGIARATGADVDVNAHGDLASVPLAVSRDGYRIIQEALTNAVRHGGEPVMLHIDVRPRTLRIEVSNRLHRGRLGRSDAARGGRGLAAIHERVRLLDGRVTAGQFGDDWRLEVELPYPSWPAHPPQ